MEPADRLAWIDVVGEADASGLLAELYRSEQDRHTGRVDNILKVHSLQDPSFVRSVLSDEHNQVTAYFAYVNRVADGLGVTTDGYAEKTYAALLDGPR